MCIREDVDDSDYVEDYQPGETLPNVIEDTKLAVLILRCISVILTLVGGVLLPILVKRRGNGGLNTALIVVVIHILWQTISCYVEILDPYYINSLDQETIDTDHAENIVNFLQHLFHGLAVYSGVLVVIRLAGTVGMLVWILAAVGFITPLILAIILLLLDIYMTCENRDGNPALIGIDSGVMVLFNLIPLGLLVTWQVTNSCRLPSRSGRSWASLLIAIILILYHIVSIIKYSIFVHSKTNYKTYELAETNLPEIKEILHEISYLLSAMALPWAWAIGLSIREFGIVRTNSEKDLDENERIAKQNAKDQVDIHLREAKQNSERNRVKARMDLEEQEQFVPMLNRDVDRTPDMVYTPPTTPMKFTPEVTSSPQVALTPLPSHMKPTREPLMSQMRATIDPLPLTKVLPTHEEVVSSLPMRPLSATEKKSNRLSYLAAVSSGSVNLDNPQPPRQSASADPLWLPASKPVEL